MENIPIEHQLKCSKCGQILDMRDLSEVLSHEGDHEPVEAEYTSSKKVGEPIEWTKDKKQIDLN